jgi:hypothetical protein
MAARVVADEHASGRDRAGHRAESEGREDRGAREDIVDQQVLAGAGCTRAQRIRGAAQHDPEAG